MPSFLEKAMRTATRAKQQVDDLRAKRDATITPDGGDALGAHERRALDRAMLSGAPDPFGLLTADEAATVLDVPVGSPALTYTDEAVGVRFSASARGDRTWSLSASVVHGTDGEPFDGPAYWRAVVDDMLPDAEPASGVGDDARWSDPYLFALQDGTVFYVDVTTPDGPDDARHRATTAAQIVAERLRTVCRR